ncbi:MAG: hypothetical protein WA240_07040 [Nitrospirota bacterium]
MEKDFIDNLKIGAIVTKKLGSAEDKNSGAGKEKESSGKRLTFSDPETHKKFVDCIFSAVKGSK